MIDPNHILKGFIAHLYSVTFCCVLFVRHEHIGHPTSLCLLVDLRPY